MSVPYSPQHDNSPRGFKAASSCMHCHAPGIVSTDQQNTNGTRPMIGMIRFYCSHCTNVWSVNANDAEQQGRFLTRAGLA